MATFYRLMFCFFINILLMIFIKLLVIRYLYFIKYYSCKQKNYVTFVTPDSAFLKISMG